jgi:hypothetical protein
MRLRGSGLYVCDECYELLAKQAWNVEKDTDE